MKTGAVILLLFIAFHHVMIAQNANATISFTNNEKDIYSIGDTLKILIQINMPPQICSDGMQKTKIYLSGLEINKQVEWKQKNNSLWEKEMELIVHSTKKEQSKITVLRRADKGDFFIQKKIYSKYEYGSKK